MVFGINFKKKTSIYKPIFYSKKGAMTIKEVFKGKKVQNNVKFPKELGVEHPFDFSMTEVVVKKVPIVSGAINKYVFVGAYKQFYDDIYSYYNIH